jgi:hypothetical protein
MIAIFTARIETFRFLYLSLGEWPRLPFTARIERPAFNDLQVARIFLEWHPCWSHCGCRARLQMLQARSFSFREGLIDLYWRSNEGF